MKTQLDLNSDHLRKLEIQNITLKTSDDLIRVRDTVLDFLQQVPVTSENIDEEKHIRWKRTASEIISDGFVYMGKSCTDITILFIAVCNILGTESRFVKLKKLKKTHSVAEVALLDGWYIFDVSSKDTVPVKGEVTANNPYKEWILWKKGHDAWDLGLFDFNSIRKINDN